MPSRPAATAPQCTSAMRRCTVIGLQRTQTWWKGVLPLRPGRRFKPRRPTECPSRVSPPRTSTQSFVVSSSISLPFPRLPSDGRGMRASDCSAACSLLNGRPNRRSQCRSVPDNLQAPTEGGDKSSASDDVAAPVYGLGKSIGVTVPSIPSHLHFPCVH